MSRSWPNIRRRSRTNESHPSGQRGPIDPIAVRYDNEDAADDDDDRDGGSGGGDNTSRHRRASARPLNARCPRPSAYAAILSRCRGARRTALSLPL